jgi:hypothetical protein
MVLGLITFLSYAFGAWSFVMRRFLGFTEQ